MEGQQVDLIKQEFSTKIFYNNPNQIFHCIHLINLGILKDLMVKNEIRYMYFRITSTINIDRHHKSYDYIHVFFQQAYGILSKSKQASFQLIIKQQYQLPQNIWSFHETRFCILYIFQIHIFSKLLFTFSYFEF